MNAVKKDQSKNLQQQAHRQDETRRTATAHRARWKDSDLQALRNVLESARAAGRKDYRLTGEEAVELARVLGRTYGAIIIMASHMRQEHELQLEHERQLQKLNGENK